MAYAYAKNMKELKKKMSKKGMIAENIGRTNPKYNERYDKISFLCKKKETSEAFEFKKDLTKKEILAYQ